MHVRIIQSTNYILVSISLAILVPTTNAQEVVREVVTTTVQTKTKREPIFVFEKNDFGNEAAWTFKYLEDVHSALVKMMDAPQVAPPSGIKIVLEKIDDQAALGGYATPDTIGFQASSWPREKFRLWILAHELTNLFANHYAGSGEFPSDWWSNGRSPFPIYVSTLICEQLKEQETAKWLRTVDANLDDQRLYWKLHAQYGFRIFAKFFELVRADGLELGKVGTHAWPSADECRSAYTIAYLSRAAGESLAPLFRRFNIGSKPKDWDQRHPERPFVEYSISNKEVADLLALRQFVFTTKNKSTSEFKRRLTEYRTGNSWRPEK